jgi:hypothetical protein
MSHSCRKVGALNTAPILIAVITSFAAIEAVKAVAVGREREASGGPNRAWPDDGIEARGTLIR